MRAPPQAMQARLDAGVTTLCRCWRIDPRIGEALGFTDHDEDIAFDGLTFEAASGFAGTAIERSLGLSIDNMTASGALRSDRLTEADIAEGRYDGAEVRLWLVDWRDFGSRFLTFRGEIGEITRGAIGFEVELRGLAERLNRSVGRRFLQVCDAEVGDSRCAFDAALTGFSGDGLVDATLASRRIMASGLGGFSAGWFDAGVLTWTSGAMSGRVSRVRTHTVVGALARLELTEDLSAGVAAGDAFTVVAGCDKRHQTCREKFNNLINFRGFPHIPGDSWIAAAPADGAVHDGGRRGS